MGTGSPTSAEILTHVSVGPASTAANRSNEHLPQAQREHPASNAPEEDSQQEMVLAVPDVMPTNATFSCLESSLNLASISTLKQALELEAGPIRGAALKALSRRKEPEAQQAIVLAWPNLTKDEIEGLRKSSPRLAAAASKLLASGDTSEQSLALSVIAGLGLTEAVDSVLDVVLDKQAPLQMAASNCLLEMCRYWGNKARTSRDTPAVRGVLVEKLHYQLVLFHEHRCGDLIEAWLHLVHWDDTEHRRILSDPLHEAHRPIMVRLVSSKSPSVIQLLAGYLTRARTSPKWVIDLLTERAEPELAVQIARQLSDNTMAAAMNSLRRLPPLPCLRKVESSMGILPAEIQRHIWLMISVSSDDLSQVLRGANLLATSDSPESYEVAAAMVRGCRRPPLEEMVSELQKASLSPGNPNLTGKWIADIAQWIDCGTTELEYAARHFFSEFTLQGLLDALRNWPRPMCKAMAATVKLLEDDIGPFLARELQSPAPKRRLAALQAVTLLDASSETNEHLLPLLDDPHLDVRVQVIDILSKAKHPIIETRLEQLLNDPSTDVQIAAEKAARRLKQQSAGQVMLQ